VVANLIVWPSLFERQRQVILSAGLLAYRARAQREGEVIHLIDLSHLLRSVGDCNEPFPVPHRRRDEANHGGGPDALEVAGSGASRGTSPAGSRSRPATSGRITTGILPSCPCPDLTDVGGQLGQQSAPPTSNATSASCASMRAKCSPGFVRSSSSPARL
jgi:hypothetical protein